MRRLILAASLVLMTASWVTALSVGAVEPLRRNIIYIHVPASISALVCFTALAVFSIQQLRTGEIRWDRLCCGCGEVGLIFAAVLNVTGMIFARSEWGPWWTPSIRLISSALLLFLYLAYVILRSSFAGERKGAKICAVFAIIAFADVPLVYASARFMRDIHRPSFSFETGAQTAAFGMGIAATLLLAAVLIWMRSDVARASAELDRLSCSER